MADDCGDCCDCDDCDCDCGDCDCDCGCDWLDNCCTGETNVILCCFLPSSNNDPRRTAVSTNTDCCLCCFWCTDRDERTATSRTSDKSTKKTKRKGCWSRLRSCFGTEQSPPSSPTRDQTGMDNVPTPKSAYNQDGRYPMNNYSRPEMTQIDYEEECRRRAIWEELDMPTRGPKMDGKWSRPVKQGDRYGGRL
ncbi:hypothetical protein vseg_015964 [Gypsophila vaccaria]